MSRGCILFLAANPIGTSRLALDRECAAIDRELRLAAGAGGLELIAKWAVTADEMMRHLVELRPTVIHFSGHATGRAASGVSARDLATAPLTHCRGICLQADDGTSQLVDGCALTKMIKAAATSARIVVLNACHSDAQAAAVCQVVDCVVGMAGAIEDEAARTFAVAFYRALTNGRSVDNAVEQGIAMLAVKHPAYESLPCYRTRDGVDAKRLVVRSRPPDATAAPVATARSAEQWTSRFEAVVSLCQEAHEKLDSDPLGTALRARLAIDHIADYLYERELAPADRAALESELAQLAARGVLPPMIATHFASVQVHTSSILEVARMAVDPRPSFLMPCLDSLAIVVEWFLWEYLCQVIPAPRAGPAPDLRLRATVRHGRRRSDTARLRGLRRSRRAHVARHDPLTPLRGMLRHDPRGM